jgi:hypothetical protein
MNFNKSRCVRNIAFSFLLLSAPAVAQMPEAGIDLSGTWAARNYGDGLANRPGPGPSPVDFLGIPLNEFARAQALLHSPSQISMPERQCSLYNPIYVNVGPFGLQITNLTEPRTGTTLAWKIGAWEDMDAITIWMDRRPHPSPNAPHLASGFTTGRWENDVLTAYTTHMKAGIIRRNGVPSSDEATMTTRFFRHGDILTMTSRIDDPMYLTEPWYVTRTFQLSQGPPMFSVGDPCVPGEEGVPEGSVPHYLPGKNPFLADITNLYNIPLDVVLGGSETMYPDVRKKFKDQYKLPPPCKRNCGGPGTIPLRTN